MNEVKGFKVFNPDWTCRGFQYEVGKTFEESFTPKCCEAGFHFCLKASDCFRYYDFNHDNKVAEVEALGDIDTQDYDSKCCTNKIHIIKEITWNEVLDLVNLGKGCTGLCNTGLCNSGDWNSGDWNSGNRNSGNRNSGNRNSGDWNSGLCNSGDWNSGDWNSGNRNSGNRNSGNRNSGDWNKTCFSNGCFNTESPKIYLFDKPSEWTYQDWLNSNAKYLLSQIQKNVVEWVYKEDMTDEEKAANPSCEATGGYLKVLDESETGQIWWDDLSESNRNIIRSLPNFDATIFEEITGVKVE